jgi:hypothetical protein
LIISGKPSFAVQPLICAGKGGRAVCEADFEPRKNSAGNGQPQAGRADANISRQAAKKLYDSGHRIL